MSLLPLLSFWPSRSRSPSISTFVICSPASNLLVLARDLFYLLFLTTCLVFNPSPWTCQFPNIYTSWTLDFPSHLVDTPQQSPGLPSQSIPYHWFNVSFSAKYCILSTRLRSTFVFFQFCDVSFMFLICHDQCYDLDPCYFVIFEACKYIRNCMEEGPGPNSAWPDPNREPFLRYSRTFPLPGASHSHPSRSQGSRVSRHSHSLSAKLLASRA